MDPLEGNVQPITVALRIILDHKVKSKVAQSCPTLQPPGLQPDSLLCPWGFSRQGYWRLPWTGSLVGYSPWGCKELDVTEQLSTLN